jgi:hypothetical protein
MWHAHSEEDRMTGQEWIAAFADSLGVPPPTDEQVEEILQLAGVAAHASERTAAPVACWIAAAAGLTPAAALARAGAARQNG